jgi:hypothetical protein
MGVNQFCVCRHTQTFSSNFDGKVFLCPSPRMLKKGSGSGQVPSLLAERAR